MCRSIKVLRGADPPVTEADIQAAALQFIRKVSGFRAPSKANHDAFHAAVAEVTTTTSNLLTQLARRPSAKQTS
jgi:hypothetical protein